MKNIISHTGILGMRWGHRKRSSEPTSSDHDRAMANRSPFSGTGKTYSAARRRFALERAVQKIQKRSPGVIKRSPKSMSDAEIKELLKNPIMKRTFKAVEEQERQNRSKTIGIIVALGAVGYMLSPVASIGAKAVLQKAVDAKRARRVVKVAADVIDLKFN